VSLGVKLALSKKLRAYVLLVKSRAPAIIAFPLATTVGCLVASRGFPPVLSATVVIMSVLAIATCVYAYNDVIDTEMDKLNPIKRSRPLPSGKVSKEEAMSLVYLAGFIGIALNLLHAYMYAKLETFLLIIVYMGLFLAYSNPQIRLKKRFLFKEGTIATGLLVSTFIGGITAGFISWGVIFQGFFFFFGTFVIYSTFVDFNDIYEDKKYGMKTLAMVLEWKTRIEIAILFILTVMIITTLAYAQLGFNLIFPVIVVAACLLFMRFLIPILNGFERLKYNRAYKSMYYFWMLMQTALIIGSFII